jgi:hypothetical protein
MFTAMFFFFFSAGRIYNKLQELVLVFMYHEYGIMEVYHSRMRTSNHTNFFMNCD